MNSIIINFCKSSNICYRVTFPFIQDVKNSSLIIKFSKINQIWQPQKSLSRIRHLFQRGTGSRKPNGCMLVSMAFFGPSLLFPETEPKVKQKEGLIITQVIRKEVKPNELRNDGSLTKLLFNIYEGFCLFLRSAQLSLTFIPIFLIYPIKYLGSSFENLWWKLFLAGIEFSGPIFIKCGQWASTRRDLFPEACCNQFTRLQRRATPHSWHYTKQQLMKAFGKNWRKVFVKFENDANPIGSGCIAQVYKVWMDESQIKEKDVLEEIIHEHDDHEDNRIGFIDDGLEVFGLRKWTRSQKEERAAQDKAMSEFMAGRALKRQEERERREREEGLKHAPHNIEDVTKEVVEEIVAGGERAPEVAPSGQEVPTSSGGEETSEHALVEQWQVAPESLEKSLPVNEEEDLENLQGLVPVALKVLHPRVYRTFRRDMTIMRAYASFVSTVFPSLSWLSLEKCVDEFFEVMEAQIDMRKEANNLDTFIHAFSAVETIRFPRPVRPFVTRRILTETFEEGEPMINFITEDKPEAIKKNLARIGVDALLKMVFTDNFTHGDLHPGNMLVQNESSSPDETPSQHDGNAPKMMMVDIGGDTFVMTVVEDPRPLRICILDCGIVARLKQKDLKNFKAVFQEVILGNGENVADLFLENSEHDCRDPDMFRNDMTEIVNSARKNALSLEQVDVGLLLQHVLTLVLKHHIRLESAFSSVVLAVFVLEGLGRSLDPEMDILERARPLLVP